MNNNLINLNIQIDELKIPEICPHSCSHSSFKKKIKNILENVNDLFVESNFSRKYIYAHILNKIIQMTRSESGFIGKKIFIDESPALHVYSITEITWNSLSEYHKPLIFKNLNSIIGQTLTTEKTLLQNTYKPSNISLPSGHPILKRVILIPIKIGNKMVGMIGLANKIKPYTKSDEEDVNTIFSVLGYLFS